MSYVITISEWNPATINQLLAGHWSKGAKLKKHDKRIVWTASLECKVPKATVKRLVGLTINLGKGQRACDPDAYWKSLLDALVKCGMLVNDSPKWVELLPVKYTRDGGKKHTIITLTDMV